MPSSPWCAVFSSKRGPFCSLALAPKKAERAFSTVHPGAIYLHLGRSYEVAELDIESRRAIVSPFDGDWYTQPKKETMVFIERPEAERRIGPKGPDSVALHFGEVSVTEQVIGYQRKRDGTQLTGREASELAHDYERAMDLAKYMIFELEEPWHWPLCSRKIGLRDQMAHIKTLSMQAQAR